MNHFDYFDPGSGHWQSIAGVQSLDEAEDQMKALLRAGKVSANRGQVLFLIRELDDQELMVRIREVH